MSATEPTNTPTPEQYWKRVVATGRAFEFSPKTLVERAYADGLAQAECERNQLRVELTAEKAKRVVDPEWHADLVAVADGLRA